MMINKKAEMTTKQIVTMIILIASFAVILFFMFKMNLFSESEKEICHNSVVFKSTSTITADQIPLKCKRSYVCLTEDRSCEEMLDPVIKRVKTKEDVYEALAEELADCWWMFGEGTLNYVGSNLFTEMHCALCSQINFDNSVKEIKDFSNGRIDKGDFYDYLAKTKVGNEEYTYLEYLYGTHNPQDFLKVDKNDPLNSGSVWGGVSYGSFDLDNQYYAITGMNGEVNTWGWVGIGTGVVVFGALTAGAGFAAIAVAAVAGGTTGYYVVAPIMENMFGGKTIRPSLIEAGNKEFDNLGCNKIVTLS